MFQIYHEDKEPCEYLPHEVKQNLFFFSPPLSDMQTSMFIAHGFRHFGNFWFKPACPGCNKCRGIRINCSEFVPTKSQRKLLRRNSDLCFILTDVTIDVEHLQLVNNYHQNQHEKFQWRYQQFNEKSYAESFLHNMHTAKEYQVRDRTGLLVGVGIIDCTSELQSSIYFYYDTSYRSKSIGIWTILQEIALCRQEGREWLHLGLFNIEARTLAYKNRFSPYELLPETSLETDAEFILHTLYSDDAI